MWLGYQAIAIQAQGLEGRRWGEFASVAEQIRRDVKRKLDDFIQVEQNRPYTDYQYYYVPENVVTPQQQMPLLRSPLGDRLEHGLAYGHFQIEADGSIVTPYYRMQQGEAGQATAGSEAREHLDNIRGNLLARLNGTTGGGLRIRSDEIVSEARPAAKKTSDYNENLLLFADIDKDVVGEKGAAKPRKSPSRRGKSLPIESLQRKQQQVQVVEQSRSVALSNVASNTMMIRQAEGIDRQTMDRPGQLAETAEVLEVTEEKSDLDQLNLNRRKEIRQVLAMPEMGGMGASGARVVPLETQREPEVQETRASGIVMPTSAAQQLAADLVQADTVQVRIEPFVPILIGEPGDELDMFGGQIFLLRHIQIESRHFLQGFQLNDKKLLEEVDESARRLVGEGMSFELSQKESDLAAYTAILDFGFGDLVLNLIEIDPAWIGKQIGQLKKWYFSIIAIVFLAVSLGLVSLWRNLREQVKLSQKKDDFISAVSHELRTPLTSIRMYTEMLEKDWIKSEDKRGEYYKNMLQESERLSRLIENVLDFSRIQRGRKKYSFQLGDINHCIGRIVDMMTPYAQQAGFVIEKDFAMVEPVTFDSDAVMQIVINLIDNAVKYARGSKEKRIIIRTKHDGKHTLIEVEDHGPGLPHRQRKKVFEEFYRCEDESRRETAGVGLGLALVKKFALAHDGFVEILAAKPTGAIFRVGLACQS